LYSIFQKNYENIQENNQDSIPLYKIGSTSFDSKEGEMLILLSVEVDLQYLG
jgi:hypothetical protein